MQAQRDWHCAGRIPAWLASGPGPQPFLCLQGVHPIAYGPLGHGKGGLLDHPVVAQVAQAAGKTPAQVRPAVVIAVCMHCPDSSYGDTSCMHVQAACASQSR